MTAGTTAVAARWIFTAVVSMLAAVIVFYCVLIGIWVYSTIGSPGVGVGDVAWSFAGVLVVALLAVGGVLLQVRWANRGADAGAITLRSLLALAAPGAVLLVFLFALVI